MSASIVLMLVVLVAVIIVAFCKYVKNKSKHQLRFVAAMIQFSAIVVNVLNQ